MTEIFGEPVEDLVAMSLGGGAGLATSAFVYPKLSGIGGGLLSNKLVGAIAQGGLTAFSAVLEGDLLVKHVTSTHNAEKFKAGGVLIGFVQGRRQPLRWAALQRHRRHPGATHQPLRRHPRQRISDAEGCKRNHGINQLRTQPGAGHLGERNVGENDGTAH